METAWRARRAEATGEATSPHPVIVGSGRPESRASTPFAYQTAPPRLPPFMAEARITLFIVTWRMPVGFSPAHATHVTHASHASPPRRRDKRAPLGEGATSTELRSSATQATRAHALLGPGPTTLGTVYGPGPGAPVGVLK